MDVDGAILAKPIESADHLMPLLPTISREDNRIAAKLEIQTESADFGLDNQHPTLAIDEFKKPFFLFVNAMTTSHFD